MGFVDTKVPNSQTRTLFLSFDHVFHMRNLIVSWHREPINIESRLKARIFHGLQIGLSRTEAGGLSGAQVGSWRRYRPRTSLLMRPPGHAPLRSFVFPKECLIQKSVLHHVSPNNNWLPLPCHRSVAQFFITSGVSE